MINKEVINEILLVDAQITKACKYAIRNCCFVYWQFCWVVGIKQSCPLDYSLTYSVFHLFLANLIKTSYAY